MGVLTAGSGWEAAWLSCVGWGRGPEQFEEGDARNGSVLTALLFLSAGMIMSMDTATVLWT